jgi:hypothetical protein
MFSAGSGQSVVLPALTQENAFPFVMPWNAEPAGTAMDVSFLNSGPAGANGRIIVRNGKFVESKTGRRVRFFGTNVGAKAAFPSLEDADLIARRMKILGINLVRFHHLHNGWDLDGGTIWKPGRTHIEIDPRQLQKLDNFVAALKRHGIYSNINLQTSREYVPALGLPETVTQIPSFQKKVDKFYPRMIELQKEYAKDLLDRVNPYTRLRYKDDPAILKVEINNENSLVGWPNESPGAGLSGLPSPFRETIVRLWNQWLLAKYGSDAGLRRGWPSINTLKGPSITTSANRWTWENQSNGDVVIGEVPDTGSQMHATALKAVINSNVGPDWHVQAHLGGLTLENGKVYTVQFRAKASQPMAFDVSSRLDKPDWRFLGLQSTVSVGTEWKAYTINWKVSASEPGHARVGFVLGKVRGTLEVQDFTIREGSLVMGVPEGASIERGTVDIPAADQSQRSRDWTAFLAQTEAKYTETMRSYLVKDLGFSNTHIIDTQASWGGLTTFLREKNSSFRDDHHYWNHPTFLGSDWDPKNYRVDRKSIVDEIGKSNGTLGAAAPYRFAGIPHSISEYNHPAPNDFQVEMMPLYAAFAAFQDWDCIYTFAWDATGTGMDNTRYSNYFDMALNPSKYAFFPSAALAFRLGLVAPAAQQAVLSVGTTPWQPHLSAWAAWGEHSFNPLTQRLAIRQGTGTAPTLSVTGKAGPPVFVSSPGEGGAIVRSDAPSLKSVVGFVGGRKVSFAGAELAFGKFGANFAALTLTSTSGAPLESAPRALLTLGARFENSNMAWNEARNSVSDQWGQGPTMAEIVPVQVTLRVNGPRKVFVLGPDGKRGKEVKATFAGGRLTFSLGSQTRAAWVEIVKS